LVGGTSGESEERIRQIFESAAAAAPSVLFLDAIDVIAGKKDVSNGPTVC
jgi:SpoVK/Ycf46/Vps4 family AAA+-type ATPase